MDKVYVYPKNSELLSIIAKTEFKPFDDMDWALFSGCESKNPLIGVIEESNHIIVIDGNRINIVHEADEFGGELYELNQLN